MSFFDANSTSNKKLNFLSINSAGSKVEVVLYNDGKIFKRSDGFKKASATLFVFIDELLTGANLELSDLNFIGVVTGPGSFTGIRIGLTAARALAQFNNLKLVTVTHHAVFAYNNKGDFGSAVLTDASNGLVYASQFDSDKNILGDIKVLTKDEINPFLSGLTANTTAYVCHSLKNTHEFNDKKIVFVEDNCDALVTATLSSYKKTGAVDYKKVEPLYIRVSQAEANLKC